MSLTDGSNYYDKPKDPRGCKITFWVLVTLGFIIILSLIFCPKVKAQRWADQNVGLYPNSIKVTINAKNHAVGLMGSHLFQKPLFNTIPVGVYGSFSRTIKPNLWVNNYRWENKYSVGFTITLPQDESLEAHHMAMIGLVWNQLPSKMWINEDLPAGQYHPGYESTLPLGLDLGWRVQINRFTAGFQIDVMNFFQYAQVSVGYCFSFYKSR